MKTKTNIPIDQQVWAKLENLAVERGVDIIAPSDSNRR